MSESLQEYSLIGLGVLLTIIPIIREIQISKKSDKKKYVNLYTTSILLISISLFVLGIKKVNRDKESSIGLENKIENIANSKTNDSLRFKEFEKNLFKEFKIIRDSITNKPIPRQTFNTVIKNADNVNIGT